MSERQSTRVEDLRVAAFPTTAEMASAAAEHTAGVLRDAVAQRGEGRVIVATGNSQIAFVQALAALDVPWDRVTVFHMDEYIGVDADHPASFQRWIRERVADPMHPKRVEYIDGSARDVPAECARYEALLREAPIDLTCMGIGENGHLAFNEPGDADFDDPYWVREIRLTPESVAQQVGEGHFPSVDAVPVSAISLTVPALLASRVVQVVTPEGRKSQAVHNTLTRRVSEDCPSTILRRTPQAVLLLDSESAADSGDILAGVR